MNLLDLARSVLPEADTARGPVTRTATAAERLELAQLLRVILPEDTGGQADALTIALADVDAALVSFRALAADRLAGAVPPPPDPMPTLPTCEDCRNLTAHRDRDGYRRCTAVRRRSNPAPDIGRRCEDFRPLPGDPDQRTGRERWPWLDQTTIPGAAADRAGGSVW